MRTTPRSLGRGLFVLGALVLGIRAAGAEGAAGYWRRTGLGDITLSPTSWTRGNFSLTVHSVTKNLYDATNAGSPPTNARPAPATRATIRWSDPPAVLLPGQRVALWGEVKNAAAPGGPFGAGGLVMLLDVPGLSWSQVTDAKVRLLLLEGTGVKSVSDVPLPTVGSGKRVLYVRAGFGEDATVQVAYPYEFVVGTPPSGPGAGASGTPPGGPETGAAPPGSTPGGAPAGPGPTPGSGPGGPGGAPDAADRRGLTTPSGPRAAARLTLEIGTNYAVPGEPVVVPVWLSAAQNLGNLNLEVRYGAGRATAARPATGLGLTGAFAFEANTAQAGVLRAGLAASAGLSGTGTLAYLELVADGAPGERIGLVARVTSCHAANGAPLDVATLDGEIRLMTSDGVLPGDADGDGVLTAEDGLVALRMSVGLLPPRLALDVDRDGAVTSADARLIFQRARAR